MATNNQINSPLDGTTGTGSFVGSASPAFTGTPTLNGYALAPITPWVAYTPTFTGFGTVSGVEFYSRRVGDVLQIRGVFASGTSTGVQAEVTLGFNGTNANVSSSGTVLTALEYCGTAGYNQAASLFITLLVASSSGFFSFGIQNASRAGYTPVTGTTLAASGQIFSVQADIPVTTWP